jgi:DNA-binding CsgD family transcriptional regulator
LAHRAVGDEREAFRLIDEELALSRACQLPAHAGEALHILAILEGPEKGRAHLDEALELLEGAPMPMRLARALRTRGIWLRLANKRVEAREPLRRAMELAHDCGATSLENEIHEELLATGARPRRAATTGRAALTPTERRVADLVARGHTNRQIAEMLFVTENTIEWHLRNVFGKLDVSSRNQIADRLGSS